MKLISCLLITLSCCVTFSCKKSSSDPGPAQQTITNFKADLNGANAGTPSLATGTFMGTYNSTTKTLNFQLSYSGLTPVAWHIHSLDNGSVEFPLGAIVPSPLESSISGFTAAEETALFANRYYVNIHTAAYAGGEISGVIEKQ